MRFVKTPTSTGVGSAHRMAAILFMLCMFGLQFGSSTESAPKVTSCRNLFKISPERLSHTFNAGEACVKTIIFPQTLNITDPRNCENFYKCDRVSCWQCPCPENTTFNPSTLQCDSSNAPCQCSSTTTTTLETESTTPMPNVVVSKTTGKEKVIPPAANSNDNEQKTPDDSSNGVVIIVVIVIATVVILMALIVGFCMWQRGVFPLRKKPSMHPSSNDGYLHTLPPQERHVYAEIDERAVVQELQNRRITEAEARRHLQHIYAPPIPSNPPPPTCVHHPHQTFVLPTGHPQRIIYPQSSYTLQSPDNRDLMRFSGSSGENKNNLSHNNNQNSPCCMGGEYIADTSSVTSCSGCSHCSSSSSHQPPLENTEGVDRRTLLKPADSTVASKHVYI